MSTCATVSFTYNALGERVEKKVGTSIYTETAYDVSGSVIGFHNRTSWLQEFVPFGATPFAKYQDGVTRFVHGNHLASTTFLTDHAGTVTQKTLYYPWGQLWASGGTVKDERFASLGLRDSETAEDPTLFRTYHPRLYRWLSPDPLAGSVFNPQSLNRYAYVLNNPCGYADPLGLDTCSFNVQFVNDVGLTDEQVSTAEQQINSILGSVSSPNGDTVGINWVSGGETDATLTATNQSWLSGLLYPNAMGIYSVYPPLSPRVYVDNLPDQANYSKTALAAVIGAVGVHELAHEWFGGEQGYDAKNLNTLMYKNLPPDTQTLALLDPNSPVWDLTPDQVGQLFEKCRAKHRGGGSSPGGDAGFIVNAWYFPIFGTITYPGEIKWTYYQDEWFWTVTPRVHRK